MPVVFKNPKSYTQKGLFFVFEEPCQFDLNVRFLGSSLQITDLNQDGVEEILLVHKLSSSNDINPSRLKIILLEGQKNMLIQFSPRLISLKAKYFAEISNLTIHL
jgi:hypothetical protein